MICDRSPRAIHRIALARSCPGKWCNCRWATNVHRRWPGWSAGDCRKANGGIIAQWCDGFQSHVAAALDRPFVVLFEQDRADETNDGIFVGEYADDTRCAA